MYPPLKLNNNFSTHRTLKRKLTQLFKRPSPNNLEIVFLWQAQLQHFYQDWESFKTAKKNWLKSTDLLKTTKSTLSKVFKQLLIFCCAFDVLKKICKKQKTDVNLLTLWTWTAIRQKVQKNWKLTRNYSLKLLASTAIIDASVSERQYLERF